MSPFLTCFPYHRSPSACLEGTHGDRVAGDNTQHSHRLLSFSFYVTRSRTKRIQTRPLTCTNRQARRSLSRRLAARTPNMHIPCIRTLRICIRSGVGVPPLSFRGNEVTVGIQPTGAIHQASTRTELRFEFCPSCFESKDFLRD